MTFRLSAVILSAALLLSCSGTQKEATDSVTKDPGSSASGMSVSPGKCRIVGTILKVSTDRSADPSSPCAKEPCLATVRIDSVLGYGSGFPQTLARGTEVEIHFAFTLSKTTKDLFPNMTSVYPGLDTGSSFRADITHTASLPGESPKPSYTVYEYLPIQ